MPILLLEDKIVLCVFCSSPAVGKYLTPEGCVCRPDDREQARCQQHVYRGGMNGDGVDLLEIYDLSFYREYLGNDVVEKHLVPDLVRGA